MTDQELNFKEMCARFDVTPRTLRYYEYIELLSPRRDGRARFYGPTQQDRMTLILQGRRFGFQLEEIRQWLELYSSGGTEEQVAVWKQRSHEKIEELKRQQEQLGEVIAELRQLLEDSDKGRGMRINRTANQPSSSAKT